MFKNKTDRFESIVITTTKTSKGNDVMCVEICWIICKDVKNATSALDVVSINSKTISTLHSTCTKKILVDG